MTGDAEKFVLLKQAFDVLSNPESRAEYDAAYKKEAPSRTPCPLRLILWIALTAS